MTIVKLNSTHTTAVKQLFQNKKYLGVSIENPSFKIKDNTLEFNELLYDMFCSNYLSDLTNFHAYGYVENNVVEALISFYESDEEPAWYYTIYRSLGNNPHYLKDVLDAVIKHNEDQSRLKFYTLLPLRHAKLSRRFQWSKYNNERYGYYDEFLVPEKNRCFYRNAWELLYKRFLLPEDSIVRCNFLKQEYRTSLPIGGNL